MNEEKTVKSQKGMVVKILVPVLILTVLAGIWIIKNNRKNTGTAGSGNPDFTLQVTQKLDLEKLKSYGIPIVIDFGSDSCVPCKKMAPVLEELNKELQGKAIIKFVDVWKYQDLADGYPISVIPTQILIDATGKPYKPSDPEGMQMIMYSKKDTGEHVFTAHEGGLTKEQLLNALKEMGLKE